MDIFTGITGLAIFMFGVVLAIAWIVLPFALIGTKSLLRELIAEVRLLRRTIESRPLEPGVDPVQAPIRSEQQSAVGVEPKGTAVKAMIITTLIVVAIIGAATCSFTLCARRRPSEGFGGSSTPMTDHVVIRRPEYVSGTRERPEVKTFTQTHQTRHPVPWGKLSMGDTVWMKWSGGPLVAKSIVNGSGRSRTAPPMNSVRRLPALSWRAAMSTSSPWLRDSMQWSSISGRRSGWMSP